MRRRNSAYTFRFTFVLCLAALSPPLLRHLVLHVKSQRSQPTAVRIASSSYPAQTHRIDVDTFPLFITGDAFRSLCKRRCERPSWQQASCNFKAEDVQRAECIFIATTDLTCGRTTTAYLHAFDAIRRSISVPYVLVTHNGDLSVPDGDDWHNNESNPSEWHETFSHWLNNELLIHWFTVNCNWYGIKPKKLTCVPLGLENMYIANARRPIPFSLTNDQVSLAKSARGSLNSKISANGSDADRLVLLAFERDDRWKPDRGQALNALKDAPFSRFVPRSSYEDWKVLVKTHTFIVCPQGHGLDTHRLWEVLLLGSFPIVRSSTLDDMFIDLPVLIVGNWSDITTELLKTWLTSERAMKPLQAAFFAYWANQIKQRTSELLIDMS